MRDAAPAAANSDADMFREPCTGLLVPSPPSGRRDILLIGLERTGLALGGNREFAPAAPAGDDAPAAVGLSAAPAVEIVTAGLGGVSGTAVLGAAVALCGGDRRGDERAPAAAPAPAAAALTTAGDDVPLGRRPGRPPTTTGAVTGPVGLDTTDACTGMTGGELVEPFAPDTIAAASARV